MKLTTLFLTLAAAVSTVNAYLITGDNVNCRSGPSTSYKIVKVYKKNTNVKLTCQTYGENIKGNTLWDKTVDGNCYVSDYYVKTGTSNMVVKACPSTGGGSSYQGTITRAEIMQRGQYWIDRGVRYSMTGYYRDPKGRNYRTDCSGFVSMALHSAATGRNTVTLPQIVHRISWSALKRGDLVGTLGPGTGGADGHVVLFHSWANSAKTVFNTFECRGPRGTKCSKHKRAKSFKVGRFTAQPYRYNKVRD